MSGCRSERRVKKRLSVQDLRLITMNTAVIRIFNLFAGRKDILERRDCAHHRHWQEDSTPEQY